MDKKIYELTGGLYHIAETQTFASGFSKREIVIKTDDPQYPQFIKLELLKDRAALVDNMTEGQTVDVAFDLQGREYNGKYYTNLICWRIKAGAESATVEQDDLPMSDDATDNAPF